jgi:hypothetical protein
MQRHSTSGVPPFILDIPTTCVDWKFVYNAICCSFALWVARGLQAWPRVRGIIHRGSNSILQQQKNGTHSLITKPKASVTQISSSATSLKSMLWEFLFESQFIKGGVYFSLGFSNQLWIFRQFRIFVELSWRNHHVGQCRDMGCESLSRRNGQRLGRSLLLVYSCLRLVIAQAATTA